MLEICDFNLIIPVKNIDRVYPGGFEQFKKDNEPFWNSSPHNGTMWDDGLLYRDGIDFKRYEEFSSYIEKWEKLGLVGKTVENGVAVWHDFYFIVDTTDIREFVCDWLIIYDTVVAYICTSDNSSVILDELRSFREKIVQNADKIKKEKGEEDFLWLF